MTGTEPEAAPQGDVLPGDELQGDVLQGGLRPTRWQRRWAGLPRAGRLLVVASVVLAAAGIGGARLQELAAERAEAEPVDLTAAVGVYSSSSAPPRGEVSYFVVVGNEGARPVWVSSVEGSAGRLRFRTAGGGERRVAAGDEAVLRLSVRLTCAGYAPPEELTAQVAARRTDGAVVTRTVRLGSADLLLHVAATLCATRPDLRDAELSGPV